MAYELAGDAYGKAQNRLLRVVRDSPVHVIRDVTVDVRLFGDFDAVYLEGDNTGIPATDTMKNSVFALGKTDFSTGSIEDFGKTLVRHWVGKERVSSALVQLTEHPWVRTHDHGFHRGSSGDHLAWVSGDGSGFAVKAGLGDLFVLRSTGSGFSGFDRDEFTSLSETRDRIVATVISAQWTYAPEALDYQAAWQTARDAIEEAFTDHYSESVQQTIYAMCTAVMDAVGEIADVTIELPNKHHNLVDLSPFGLENPNEVFIATQDPFGLITGTVRRV
jgi:urate oxidase